MTTGKIIHTNLLTEQALRIAETFRTEELCFLDKTRAAQDFQIFQTLLTRHLKDPENLHETLVMTLHPAQVQVSFDIKVSHSDNEAYVSYIRLKDLPGTSESLDTERIDRELKMLVAETLISR